MKKQVLALAAIAAVGMPLVVYAMSETPSSSAASAQVAEQSNIDLQHRVDTLQTGKLALETSKIALARASNPLVRQFAQLEVDEQTTVAEIFKSMYPTASDVTLTPANNDKFNQLKTMSSTQFDGMYVQTQLEGHKKLLEIQNDYIAGSRNREEMNIAKLARGQIREHIILLSAFQQQLK